MGRCCVGQVLRERVAAGRKLVEAIQAALPATPLPAEAPVGQRARRARSEYGSHRRSTTPERQAGVLRRPMSTLSLAVLRLGWPQPWKGVSLAPQAV